MRYLNYTFPVLPVWRKALPVVWRLSLGWQSTLPPAWSPQCHPWQPSGRWESGMVTVQWRKEEKMEQSEPIQLRRISALQLVLCKCQPMKRLCLFLTGKDFREGNFKCYVFKLIYATYTLHYNLIYTICHIIFPCVFARMVTQGKLMKRNATQAKTFCK